MWLLVLESLKKQVHFEHSHVGFKHWSSGQIERIQVNLKHPQFCHVKSYVQPSMKQGMYEVYVLLCVAGECEEVASATCDCAAG